MKIALSFIQSAVAEALGLPRTNIQTDIIEQGVDYFNLCGRLIWDSLFWQNRLVDQFEITPVSGVITFDPSVDVILAVRGKDASTANTSSGTFIWAQNQISSAITGHRVEPMRWTLLSDDPTTGARRAQLPDGTSDATVYIVLATRRFVEATIEATYNALQPTLTPTDYRVINWTVDFADMALQAFITDKMRIWQTQTPTDEWKTYLQQAMDKAKRQMQTEDMNLPADPTFSEVGGFYQ